MPRSSYSFIFFSQWLLPFDIYGLHTIILIHINFSFFYSGAAYLISSVSIDLSKYALDICKNTVGQLRAKEELHRQEATLILKNLAHQCSDPGAMEELINYLFAVLNGKDLLNILYQTIFWLTMFLCTM